MSPVLISVLIFAAGFAAGYGLRTWISLRRRVRSQRADSWAGLPRR